MAISILILIAFHGKSQPATSFANASAAIVTPVTISKNEDINFGIVGVRSSYGGSLVLSPEGNRYASSGVVLQPNTGNVTAADFTVMGSNAYTYTIGFPASVVLSSVNSGETMLACGFTSIPAITGLLTGGMQRVKIGATLSVSALQKPGLYSTADFEVMVYYN